MNTFQKCKNTSDVVPLYLPQRLYLKPVARVNISLQLPRKTMGKSISSWEVMDKIRNLVEPEEFTSLKVTKTTLEFIRLEGEIDNRDKLSFVVERLNHKMIKLKEFTELLHLKSCEAKSDFPTRHTWDSFFRESKDMNETKPGERPDTIHISNLPIKWFVHPHLMEIEDLIPSEKIFYRVFEKFGRIRNIDIPICDPYRKNMKSHMTGMQIFSFDEKNFFEGYVQFKDYIGFAKAMEALRNMKLLRRDDEGCVTVSIKVDFDKTKHLSEAAIRRREIVRDRLVAKAKKKEEREIMEKEQREMEEKLARERKEVEKTEKEKRREERERKRKQKILAKLKINSADEITQKIAKEEKKLIKVQRKLEAIRLVEELFRRIKIKYEKNNPQKTGKGEDELTRYKSTYETEVRQQRDRLHKAIEGRVILRSVLSEGGTSRRKTGSSSGSLSLDSSPERIKEQPLAPPYQPYPPDWIPYSNGAFPNPFSIGGFYKAPGMPEYLYQPRGRGRMYTDLAGPSRGSALFPRRGRGYNFRTRGARRNRNYYQSAQKEYEKYFEKFLHEHDDRRNSKSRSRSRSRSYSRRRTRSRSRKRSYSRSRKNSRRSQSYSRRSRSNSRRSRSNSRKSRSYSKRSRSNSKNSPSGTPPRRNSRRSRSISRRSRRSRSNSRRYSDRSKSRSESRKRRSSSRRTKSPSSKRSKSYEVSEEKDKTRRSSENRQEEEVRSASVDSSKFVSPQSMRKMRSRSKSWSLPKDNENEKNGRSWSSSPTNKKKSD